VHMKEEHHPGTIWITMATKVDRPQWPKLREIELEATWSAQEIDKIELEATWSAQEVDSNAQP
jgi:hypothetical protein